jgi:hypothetical protein
MAAQRLQEKDEIGAWRTSGAKGRLDGTTFVHGQDGAASALSAWMSPTAWMIVARNVVGPFVRARLGCQ